MIDLLLHTTTPSAQDVSTLVTVGPEEAQWDYCSLTVLRMKPGATWQGSTSRDEIALVPLSGNCTVTSGDQSWSIGGRASLFDGPTSSLYLPINTEYTVTAEGTVELAICGARAEKSFPPRFISADEVLIEIRGAGNAARQINHIIKPDFAADRLLVVEVYTPSGNWSSFPPHKHDVSRMPAEADLEEI
jgi:5-deoxy-glucuronate isomerase